MVTPAESNDNKPNPPAAGQFGIVPGLEVRHYRPTGCPSLEQFEASFLLANQRTAPMQAA